MKAHQLSVVTSGTLQVTKLIHQDDFGVYVNLFQSDTPKCAEQQGDGGPASVPLVVLFGASLRENDACARPKQNVGNAIP